MSVLILVLGALHFALIAGETIVAQEHEFIDQHLYCASNEACVVYCKEESSCRNATIYCPVNELCVVSCGQHSNACNGVTIDARYSSLLELTDCASGDDSTCAAMTVYAPPNDNGDKRAILATGDVPGITLYAVFGWRDIDTSRFNGQYSQIEGDMFCSYEYDDHCVLDDSEWQCQDASHACNDGDSLSVEHTGQGAVTSTAASIMDTIVDDNADEEHEDEAGSSSFVSNVESLLIALDTSWYMVAAFAVLMCCCACLMVTCLYRRVNANFASIVQHKLDRQKSELQEIRSMIEQSSGATMTATAQTTSSMPSPSQHPELPRATAIQQQRSDTNTFEREEDNMELLSPQQLPCAHCSPCAHHQHPRRLGCHSACGSDGDRDGYTYPLQLQRDTHLSRSAHVPRTAVRTAYQAKISDLHSKSTPALREPQRHPHPHSHSQTHVDTNEDLRMKMRAQMTPAELVMAIRQDVVMEHAHQQEFHAEHEDDEDTESAAHATQVSQSLASQDEYYKNVHVFQPPAIQASPPSKKLSNNGGTHQLQLALAADRDTMSTTSKPSDTFDMTDLSQLSDLTSQRDRDEKHDRDADDHHHQSDTSSINWDSLEFSFNQDSIPTAGANNYSLQTPAPSQNSGTRLGRHIDSIATSRQSSTAPLSSLTASTEPKYRLQITCHDSINTTTTTGTTQASLSTVTSSPSTTTSSKSSTKSKSVSKSATSNSSNSNSKAKSDTLAMVRGNGAKAAAMHESSAPSLAMNRSSTELTHLTASKATNTNRTVSTSLSSEPTPADTAQPVAADHCNKPKLTNNASNSTMHSTDDSRVDAISVPSENGDRDREHDDDEEEAASESACMTVNDYSEDEDEDEDEDDGIVDIAADSDINPNSPSHLHELQQPQQQHEEEPLELITAGSGSSASEPSDIGSGSSVQSHTASVLSSMMEGDCDDNSLDSGSEQSSLMEDLVPQSSVNSFLPIYEDCEKQ